MQPSVSAPSSPCQPQVQLPGQPAGQSLGVQPPAMVQPVLPRHWLLRPSPLNRHRRRDRRRATLRRGRCRQNQAEARLRVPRILLLLPAPATLRPRRAPAPRPLPAPVHRQARVRRFLRHRPLHAAGWKLQLSGKFDAAVHVVGRRIGGGTAGLAFVHQRGRQPRQQAPATTAGPGRWTTRLRRGVCRGGSRSSAPFSRGRRTTLPTAL